MSAKIIEPNRYKKTTRKKSKMIKEAKRKEIKLSFKKERKFNLNTKMKNDKVDFYSIFKNGIKDNDQPREFKYMKKYNKKDFMGIFKISVCIIVILGLSIISKKIVNKYFNQNHGEVVVNLNSGKTVSLMQNSVLKIGVSKLSDMNLLKNRNVILNEIYRLSSLSLISFGDDYDISYKVAKSIEKVNNQEYLITLNKDYKIGYEEISNSVKEIKNAGKNNIYFNAISKIKEIKEVDKETIKITLSEANPYFIFSLNFPILSENNKNIEYELISSIGNEINFSRSNSTSTVSNITIKNYTDIDNMIADFRNNNIDIFTASSDSIMSLVGKHDYSIKKYRDGNTLFLLGNSKSNLFSRKEVRKAVLYSIDRDEIIRNLNDTFLEKIDIPYIHSDIQYKYDTYGAQNALLSQGWTKSSGIYSKIENKKQIKIELNLLVNGEDKTKVEVAGYIKKMLEENGIKLNIKSLKAGEFNAALNKKEYDMVLADISINEIPDISFIEQYLNINDTVSSAINIFKKSSTEELFKNLNSLKNTLSNEVACIGIYASNTNVVYQTNLAGFSDISYMNIFNHFTQLGKIQDTNKGEE